MQCSKCGRSFGADSISKHSKNCGRVFHGRKFDASHYVVNTPGQKFKIASAGSRLGRSNRAAKERVRVPTVSTRSSIDKIAERAKLPGRRVKPVVQVQLVQAPPPVSYTEDDGFDVSELLWGENETPANVAASPKPVVGLHPFDHPSAPATRRKYILPKFSESPSTKTKTRYDAATEVIRGLQAVPAHKTTLPVRRYM